MADIKLEIDTTQASEAIAGLQDQADKLLSTLEKCRDCTKECGVTIDVTGVLGKVGRGLGPILRNESYR